MSSDHGDDSAQGGNDTPQGGNDSLQTAKDTPLVYGEPALHSPVNDTDDVHNDCSGFDAGSLLGNLNVDALLGGSVSVGSGLIDVNLDGETGNSGALLNVVAGGEGLGHLAADLNTDALGDMGLLGGAPSCLLGNLDVLDNVLCDGILT